MRLTVSVLDYARHAQIGRVHYLARQRRTSPTTRVAPKPLDMLTKIATAKNVAEALDSYHPPQPAYKALKKLAEARGQQGRHGPAQIAGGPVLKIGPTRRAGRS